ncbi:MAG: hypothetical protein KC502_21005 [Myxococcales bacterium]|nr:hypothetical protein [Myxococcales bacterium]
MARRKKAGKLRPIALRVRRIQGGFAKLGERIDERRLAKGLRSGAVRSAVVVGLGGVGKSTFAKALEALVCSDLPTVRVDLNRDVGQRLPRAGHTLSGPEPNAVLAAAASALGVPPDARQGKLSAAARALGGGPWLLLLDSLDEVSDAQHSAVLKSVQDALARSPKARVLLFTRPPVSTPLAQLSAITTVVEIEPQTCQTVATTLKDWAKRRPAVAKVPAVLSRLGLDRRVQLGGRCAHPHLMTWRDLSVATRLARWRLGNATPTWDKQFDGSRASLYRLYALDRLPAGIPGSPRQLLGVLDDLAQGHMQAKVGQQARAITASHAECVAAGQRFKLTDPAAFCRALFRSRLFAKKPQGARIGFRNQSIADWLIARQLDHQLGNQPKASRCDAVARHDRRFRSSEIAAFFVGMPHGRACLATVARSLCATRSDHLDLVRTLERGLPWGELRTQALGRASQVLAGGRHNHDACAKALIASVARP